MARYAELFRTVVKGSGAEPSTETVETNEPPGNRAPFTLLFVDDEPGVLNALRRIFLEENYTILTVTSAAEALEVMEARPVQLVISDHRMAGMTGGELLKRIRERWPETIRIMLTGHSDVHSIMGGVRDGAVYKFITKPWNDEDLRLTVSLALQQYVLIQENRKLKEAARRQQLKIKNSSGLFGEDSSMLGTILTQGGIINAEQLAKARREGLDGEILADALVRLGLVSEAKIMKALQDHLRIAAMDLREAGLVPGVVKSIPREICERSRLIPVKLEGNVLTIAMADPSDLLKCDNIAMVTGLKVVPVLAASSAIVEQLKKVYADPADGGDDREVDFTDIEPLDEIDIVIEDESEVNVDDLLGSSKVPPIIRIVNAVISEAIRYRASDLHVEPKTKHTVVRYRIDGMLHSKFRLPPDLHPAIVSRLKILARMDIAERRRPQDGRITVRAGTRLVDLRVSSMPTINGEKMVLRILDKGAAIKRLDELGGSPADLKKIAIMVRKPHGVIVATGPTGSGKTTMLYSMLGSMMVESRNFETIEDPVEYFLEEANQVHIRENIGLSFSSVLRSTLRQDLDVLLIGEMRDFETADTAFKAALTGHLVLTTLHTNNAVSSITRLMDMGIKPYIIASALEGVVAQRLVRQVCDHCREPELPDPSLMELLRIPQGFFGGVVYKGKGCSRCNHTGYAGRIGVFEVFTMNDDFRHMISSGYREPDLAATVRASGMKSLLDDGVAKVAEGMTTLEELLRVLGPQSKWERQCRGCQRMVDAKFPYCPHCGFIRQGCCSACKAPLEDDWRVCPFCGTGRMP